jgi:3-oxoacyl-[acyl-carrier protein] reductase
MTELALVTGGSGHIGAAISEKLTADGFDVVVIDKQAPTHSFLADFVEVDLSQGEETRDVLSRYCKGRPVTRLINNAGIVRRRSFEEATIDDFNAVMQVNVQAALVASQVVVPECAGPG